MSNSSIWPVHRTLSGVKTPGKSRPGSDDNERVLHIPQNSCISGASSPNCLVSCTGHSLRESYPPAEMQSVYSIAPVDWATKKKEKQLYEYFRRQTNELSQEKAWTCWQKKTLKREREPLVITTQKDTKQSNYVKRKTDKIQQNNKCMLYIDRDETINHIKTNMEN